MHKQIPLPQSYDYGSAFLAYDEFYSQEGHDAWVRGMRLEQDARQNLSSYEMLYCFGRVGMYLSNRDAVHAFKHGYIAAIEPLELAHNEIADYRVMVGSLFVTIENDEGEPDGHDEVLRRLGYQGLAAIGQPAQEVVLRWGRQMYQTDENRQAYYAIGAGAAAYAYARYHESLLDDMTRDVFQEYDFIDPGE